MGNIYTKDIKRIVVQIYEQHKDEVSTDFAVNKKIVDTYIDANSKKVKNRIAGYLTRYTKMARTAKETPEVVEEE
ncbi:hypothetical protein CM19_09375 [Candidatus Acidianus copahuensis]|uniref:Small ribosomal subunit protein eS17 n=1 Tax=Candidatus Acidianus copahuensis TaxID=1160895 RepID=A0A031LNC9_9CREN|nr:30S ribosomal protein S17e [Candidatus Acidianus copahuensis]EZQ03044.1 hypothetical protein CM19_09375 [Candidatus Acidianus copahuensis]